MTLSVEDMNISLLYNGTIDPTEWVGLKKSYPLLVYLRVIISVHSVSILFMPPAVYYLFTMLFTVYLLCCLLFTQ